MGLSLRGAACAAAAVVLSSCGDRQILDPAAAPGPSFLTIGAERGVRFSELHYDNAGADTGEAVEIAGPAGTDLAGWTVVLYNGNGGTAYRTSALSGSIPASCGAEGAVVVRYPANGIQNGAPDGLALVNAAGMVVEFLSYEGVMTAVGGPADGMTSTDVGVAQSGSGPVGESVQRNGFGGWAPGASTFGGCNDEPPPPYDGPTTVVINELMGAPLASDSESWGEWFEVHNYGAAPVNLGGWKIRSGGEAEHTVAGDVVVAPGGHVVLGRASDRSRNGDVDVAYNYFTGSSSTIWLGSGDWLALRTPGNVTVDSVQWNSLPVGATRALRDAAVENAAVDGPNWGFSTTPYGGGDFGTPNAANGELGETAPPVPTGVVRISFGGRNASDPPLPVGFQDQLFATARDASRNVVQTAFTWSSATPELATVDQNGVVTARGSGVAVIRATSADGRVGSYALPTHFGIASTTASYLGNAAFGEPTDADAGDDFLVRRAQFTASYSRTRGTPNWVSYNLEATHFGREDRCDCFTPEPLLPADYPVLSTADYTGAGSYHGYGIDRGHMVRSADRTAGSLDNASTYYFSNIIPQASDNNQGPWSVLEMHLGDLARDGNREVYIVTGVAGSRGTLKDEGRIVIPASVWKVAVIMPRDAGPGDVGDAGDFELVAVEMPNVAGIRNVDWNTYRTTVNAIEASSGYDLLARLPNHVEWLVEAGLTSPSDIPAARLVEILTAGVQEMTAAGQLSAGNGNSLGAKLQAAAASLARGNGAAARGQLRAFGNEVQAMVRSGRLSAEDGESLRIVAGWAAGAAD